jgi:hypothetical protein
MNSFPSPPSNYRCGCCMQEMLFIGVEAGIACHAISLLSTACEAV